MNLRGTLILFGLLLAALGTFAAFQWLGVRTSKERAAGRKFVLPSLNDQNRPVGATDFEKVVIERPNPDDQKSEKLEFVRENNQWRLASPAGIRIDDAAVTTLVNQLKSLQREDAQLKDSLASYGLDAAPIKVVLTKGKTDYRLEVGNQGPAASDPLYYVASSERPGEAQAVRKSRLEKLFAPLGDLRDKRVFSTSFGIDEVTLAGKERPRLHLVKEGESAWKFKEPALGAADLASVNAVTLDLTNLRVEKNADFIRDGATDAEAMKKYGLTEADAAYIVALRHPMAGDPNSQVTETLLIGLPDESAAAAALAERYAPLVGQMVGMISSGPLAVAPVAAVAGDAGSAPEPTAYYAMKQGEGSIFRLSKKQLDAVRKSANEFRAKTVAAVDAVKLDAIDIKAGGETMRLRRATLKPGEAADWLIYTDSRAKVPAQNRQVQQLIDALNRVAVKDASAFLEDGDAQRKWFGTDAIDLGLDHPQAEILLWTEALERDSEGKLSGTGEPTFKAGSAEKPTTKITVGRRDAQRGVVYVRGEQPGLQPVILALPDPWLAPAPAGFDPGAAETQALSLSESAGAGYLSFRNRDLPSFRITDPTELRVERPSGRLELTRKEDTSTPTGAPIPVWSIVKPFEAKAMNVEGLLNSLVGMAAEKLVTDRPTEQDLTEKFGLGAQPLMKFVLRAPAKAAGKFDEHTYTIGHRTPAASKHPDHHYARLVVTPGEGPAPDSNQLVFLVTQAQVQMLDQELRDPTIFGVETSQQPSGLTLTWRKLDEAKKLSETKLELAPAEDGPNWVVKSFTVDGQDQKSLLPVLDQGRLAALIGLPTDQRITEVGPRLNPLVAERFLIQKGQAKPKMRLDASSAEFPPVLVAELTFQGGAKRTLILGDSLEASEADFPGSVGRKFFLAATPERADAVFLLGEVAWKDLVSGPQFFRPSDTEN